MRKILGIALNILLSASFLFIEIDRSKELMYVFAGVAFLWATVVSNALLSTEIRFEFYFTKVLRLMIFFTLVVYFWGVMILPAKYFKTTLLESYWITYLLITLSENLERRVKSGKLFFDSKLNYDLLFYYLWAMIFLIFVSLPVIILGNLGFIVGPGILLFVLVVTNNKKVKN